MAKYLLVPVMPTPNGPLHLGHVAGPFLKIDVIARLLRREGHCVAIVSASDPYETHVLPRADALGITPTEVCRHFHREIEVGLRSLDIQFDRFIDPLAPQYHERLVQSTRATLTALAASGSIEIHGERVPFSTRHGFPIVGSLIGGTCSECGVTDAGGFHCEECGAENSPQDLYDVRSEINDDEWQWRPYRSAFLRIRDPDALLALLTERSADNRLLGIARRHLSRTGNLVRLSHPGHWGIPCDVDGVTPGSVVFSYTALFTLSHLCGEEGATLIGEVINPLQKPSTVFTIKSFGFDNVIPYFVSVNAQALAVPGARPFTHFLTNYFCTLGGEKFSTSRGHAIWAHEATRQLDTDVDTLRLFLALGAAENGPVDFSRHNFTLFKETLGRSLQRGLQNGETAAAMSWLPGQRERLAALLNEQAAGLCPRGSDLPRMARCLLSWIEGECADWGTRAGNCAAALLAAPLMPSWALQMWVRAGMSGSPSSGALEGLQIPAVTVRVPEYLTPAARAH